MKSGLEEFLKRIEAKPTNETLIDRFMTLVLEEEGVDRILCLKSLVGLLLKSNPYAALKAAYVELQEARKEKLHHEYEIGALKDVESCFLNLGKTENAAIIREEISKLQNEFAKSKGVGAANSASAAMPSVPQSTPSVPSSNEAPSNGGLADAAALAPSGSAAQAFFASLANKVKGGKSGAPQPPQSAPFAPLPPGGDGAGSDPGIRAGGTLSSEAEMSFRIPTPSKIEGTAKSVSASDDADSAASHEFSMARDEPTNPTGVAQTPRLDQAKEQKIREAKARAETEERERLAVEAKMKAEEDEREKRETEAREKFEADERMRLEIEAKIRAEAEEEARLQAEADERQRLEAEALAEAEERKRLEAEALARAEAEEQIRLEAEALARAEAEEQMRLEAEALARAEAEEQMRLEAEALARAEAEEQMRLEAEALARAEAEEQMRLEAEALARAEAEEQMRLQAEAKIQAEAEERARQEAKAKAAAEDRARMEAEARVKIAAEMKAKAESEAKAKAQVKNSNATQANRPMPSSIPNAADEISKMFSGSAPTKTTANKPIPPPEFAPAPSLPSDAAQGFAASMGSSKLGTAQNRVDAEAFDFGDKNMTRTSHGGAMVLGSIDDEESSDGGFAPLATSIAVGLPPMVKPQAAPTFSDEATRVRPGSFLLEDDDVTPENASPLESASIAFEARMPVQTAPASTEEDEEDEDDGEFGLSFEYSKRNAPKLEVPFETAGQQPNGSAQTQVRSQLPFSLKSQSESSYISTSSAIDEAFEPQPFFQPDDDDEEVPPPAERTMSVSIEKLDESREQIDLAANSSAKVQHVRIPINSGPNFVVLDDDDTEVTKIEAPIYADDDEPEAVSEADEPSDFEASANAPASERFEASSSHELADFLVSEETAGDKAINDPYAGGMELSFEALDALDSEAQEAAVLKVEAPLFAMEEISEAVVVKAQMPSAEHHAPAPMDLTLETEAPDAAVAPAPSDFSWAPEAATPEAPAPEAPAPQAPAPEAPAPQAPAPESNVVSLAEFVTKKQKGEWQSSVHWSTLKERLSLLTGFNSSRTQLIDFTKKLLQSKTETARVQKVVHILTQFMDQTEIREATIVELSVWLFEELEPGSLHELFVSMNMKDELLDLYLDHIDSLRNRHAHRLALSLMHDILRFELDDIWYTRSYPVLKSTWERLGLEGWHWLPEEGGAVFCDRLARREEPMLSTLLA